MRIQPRTAKRNARLANSSKLESKKMISEPAKEMEKDVGESESEE